MGSSSKLFQSQDEASAFAEALPTYELGKRLDYFSCIESTNTMASKEAAKGAPHGLVVIADEQMAGRGRRGRVWEAPVGSSLLFSVLVRPDKLPHNRFGWLALTTGWAIAESLEARTRVPVTIKWPNDIVVQSEIPSATPWRKLGGILIEGVMAQTPASFFVIGVGLNISQSRTQLPVLPKAPATSLYLESGDVHHRTVILTSVLESLEKNLELLANDSGFAFIQERVLQRLNSWWEGKVLHLKDSSKAVRGHFVGLDEFGCLQVKDAGGTIHTLSDAEVLEVW